MTDQQLQEEMARIIERIRANPHLYYDTLLLTIGNKAFFITS